MRYDPDAALDQAIADIDALRAENDRLRARLAEVEAERDSAEERLVPVVELINSWWDKPGSLTYDEAFTAVEAALSVTAGVEQFCTRKNYLCDYPDCSCVQRDPIHQTTTPAEVDQ